VFISPVTIKSEIETGFGNNMALIAPTNALKAFSACSTALAIKMLVTLSIQGGKSFDAGVRPPEDGKYNKEGMPAQNYGIAGAEHGEVPEAVLKAREIDYRWKRIVQNDLENIPIGLVVLLGSILVGGNDTANVVLLAIFTFARIAHTYAYANQMQPHRALLWSTGQLCVVAGALNGLISFIIG
jgi:glutathione S-transferase